MSRYNCRPSRAGRPHDFDEYSGWCIHGCGVRDDGKVVSAITAKPIATPTVPDITEPRRRPT